MGILAPPLDAGLGYRLVDDVGTARRFPRRRRFIRDVLPNVRSFPPDAHLPMRGCRLLAACLHQTPSDLSPVAALTAERQGILRRRIALESAVVDALHDRREPEQ